MLDVYCDNKELLNRIIDAKRPKGKLYPHELAMLFYCSIGQIQVDAPRIADVFKYQLKVDYPVCLLYSLIDRGYIRDSVFPENVQFYKTKELQAFVRERGGKSSSRHDTLLEIIFDNYTIEEIYRFFQRQYYLPTILGREELALSGYTIQDAYDGWRLNNGYRLKSSIAENEILIVYPIADELNIVDAKDGFDYLLKVNGHIMFIKTRFLRLPKREDISIKRNEKEVYKAHGVDIIEILRNNRILIFERELENDMVSVGFNFLSEEVLYQETISKERRPPVSFKEYILSHKQENNCIEHDGVIDYYVSVNNSVSYILIKKYLCAHLQKASISIIQNYIDDDITENVKISILESDTETRNLVQFLAGQRHLLPPSINGISLGAIAWQLYTKHLMRSEVKQTYICLHENEFWGNVPAAELVSRVETQGRLSVLEDYIFGFPYQALASLDYFRYYDSFNGYANDNNWEYAKSNESALREVYNGYLLAMKEKGILPVRWINEFSLFLLVKKRYQNAIYQYHCDWLGLQSFDIFIPEKNIAIEYQGIQHYKPIEMFGGNAGYAKLVERDKRKRELSASKNVKVYDWKYTIPVNSQTVADFLSQF